MICQRCHKVKLGVPRKLNTLGMDLCYDCIGDIAQENKIKEGIKNVR